MIHKTAYTMMEKVKFGEAIDVSIYRRTSEGDYILDHVEEGCDYCDTTTGRWIWSIGRDLKVPGRYVASTGRKYQNRAGFECVWLR
jgi:hypothetical protein